MHRSRLQVGMESELNATDAAVAPPAAKKQKVSRSGYHATRKDDAMQEAKCTTLHLNQIGVSAAFRVVPFDYALGALGCLGQELCKAYLKLIKDSKLSKTTVKTGNNLGDQKANLQKAFNDNKWTTWHA